MKIGYIRCSKNTQNTDRQKDILSQFNLDRLYEEKITGTVLHRPELDKCMEVLRSGDTLYVESLSRLGRSTKDLLFLLDKLKEMNVNVVSVKENIDTNSATGKLLTTVMIAISQFERDVIVQRTNEGLTAARMRGRKGGRPKTNNSDIQKAIKLWKSKAMSISEICKITGISQTTLYNYLHKNDLM